MKILKRLAIAFLAYILIGGVVYGGMVYLNYRRAQATRDSIRVASDAAALAKLLGSSPKWFWLDFRGDREKCDGMIHPESGQFKLYFPKDPKLEEKTFNSLSALEFKEQVARCAKMTVVYQLTFDKAIFEVDLSSGLVTAIGPVQTVD